MPLWAHLQLVLSASEPGIHKGAEVVFEFRIGCQNRENILVAFVQKLDGVRKGAVPSPVVDAQEPDHGGEEDDRTFDEEIALLLHPASVQVEHDGIGTLVGIRNIGHEVRVNGVATVRAARVVEVYDVERRNLLVAPLVIQQVVVGDLRKVGKFVVVNVLGVALFDLLFNELIDNTVAFPAARASHTDTSSLRIYYVCEPAVPLLVIVKLRRQIYGVFVLDQAGFLLE